MTDRDEEIEKELEAALERRPGRVTIAIHDAEYTIWESVEEATRYLAKRAAFMANAAPTTPELTYPMPGFPKTTEHSTEDWVPIDGQWHYLVYVHYPHGVATDLYVDGKLVPVSGETEPVNGFRNWTRALSLAQIDRLFQQGPKR